MVLEYVALGLIIIVVLVMFYGIIAIHDMPYEIAVKRNHPHQDADRHEKHGSGYLISLRESGKQSKCKNQKSEKYEQVIMMQKRAT